MNKTELVDQMADAADISKAAASRALDGMVEAMGAKIVDRREEPGSLEDFFVAKIGHKVT